MSGVTPLMDTLLVTRLAQRADLVPLKAQLEIAGPGAVTNVESTANDVRLPSRAASQRELGGELHGGHSNFLPVARLDGAVMLSAAARAVSMILETPSAAVPKIRGSEPLWSGLRPPVAQLLAPALARTVSTSGLFYESHLKQYAAGTRSLAQLALEPQAQLDVPGTMRTEAPDTRNAGRSDGPGGVAPPASAPVMPDLPGLSLPDAAVAGTESPVPMRLDAAAGDNVMISGEEVDAASSSHALSVDLAAQLNAVSLAEIYAGVSEKEYVSVDDVAAQQPAGHSAAEPLTAMRSDSLALSGIHPGALALVRQQLELLATPVFRWEGEAWRGTPMDWEIHQECDEAPASPERETAQRVWATRLMMTLPTLRDVEVRLILTDATLQVRLAARHDATVVLLSAAGGDLQKRFDALGLQLTGLQVGALAAEPAEHDASKAADAANAGVKK